MPVEMGKSMFSEKENMLFQLLPDKILLLQKLRS